MGDGLLVEFPSPVHAVQACLRIQSAMVEHEADQPEDSRIRFRVGINLGDGVVEGDDILGHGVNIAARLETLCEPGGIVISNAIHEQVKGKLSCGFTDLGPQQVKNLPEPVNAFAVGPVGAAPPRDSHATNGRPCPRSPPNPAPARCWCCRFRIIPRTGALTISPTG